MAVTESEERYRAIFESANDGIVTVDAKGCITAINERVELITGHRREDFLGKNIAELDVLTPKNKELILENFSKRMRGMSVPPYEIEIIASDGTRLSVELNATPLREKGEVTGEIVILRDITERKEAEEALRQSEEKYRLLAENMTDLIFVQDMNLDLIYVSPSVTLLSGYSVEEALKLKMKDMMTPDSLRKGMDTFQEKAALANEKKDVDIPLMEYEYVRKDGSTFWGELKITFLRDSKGRPVGCQGVLRDITERKQMEQQLRQYSEQLEQMVSERTAELEESKALIESMFNGLADAVIVTDREGIIVAVNSAATEFLGYREDELIGCRTSKLLVPRERHLSGKMTTEVIAKGVTLEYERTLLTKDGVEIPVVFHGAPLRDAKGEIIGTIAVARDMRQIKSLIGELQQSRAYIESMFNAIADPILVVRPDRVITAVNKAMTELLGYEEDELIGHNYIDTITPPEMRHLSGKLTDQVIAEGVTLTYERIWQTKDGVEIPVALHTAPLRDGKGAIIGIIVAARDMRQIKSLIGELEQSKALIESIFNAVADPITVVGKDLNYIAVNKATEELLGYREDELIGCRSSKLLAPRERHLSGGMSREAMAKGVTLEFERPLLTKDGVEIPVLHRVSPLRDAEGEVIGVVAISRDLRKEKALIAELARSEERYRAIFEHAPVAITVADSSNTIKLWNEQAERQTGYKAEEVIGKSRRAGIPNDLLKEAKWLMEQVKEKGYVEGYETERVTKDGVRFPVELTMAALRDSEGNFIGSMLIVTDISERKKLERERAEAQERLLWAERLAAIGQVASGMAHELRQPLSVINNAAYFLKMKLDADDEKVKRHLDILEKEVAICESIISDVLDFVRPKKPVRKQVDINLVIEEALSQATLPPGIAVVTEFKELPPLTGDPNQLERVFLNIILNAAQAMPDGGRLVIRTERDNDLIRAEIEDSGSGIPEEDLRRVFEPLFTRRAAGTGLGLPLAKSIIEAHHGAIDIESEVDHGTRVAVELPLRGRRGR